MSTTADAPLAISSKGIQRGPTFDCDEAKILDASLVPKKPTQPDVLAAESQPGVRTTEAQHVIQN
jgi:hypothetical protein